MDATALKKLDQIQLFVAVLGIATLVGVWMVLKNQRILKEKIDSKK